MLDELTYHMSYRFQWVFCQLETLRHAVQPDVRGTLEALPRTLDETYERVLKNINEKNRKHACRLLHCLAVAVRPFRVEELAEILTFDFDGAQGGIPKFHVDRRPNDLESAVLSTCSSLITIVDNRDSRVVQFSHLSVKEFLTSNHLASSTGHLSLYHILPGPAHTVLAQVSLGLLLHLDDRNYDKNVGVSPLAEYAARHWVAHAQFEDVASRVMGGMMSLFDPDKPHFAAWIGLFNIDAESGGRLPSEIPNPLYYAAHCGFHGLVRHIAIKRPQQVNAIGGSFGFPLVAALCRNHAPVAELLLEHGGRVDVRDTRKQTVLDKTIDRRGKVAIDAVQFLLEHGVDVNARRDDLWTPLHLAVNIGELSVARILLEHRAEVNARNDDGQAPLHLLSKRETSKDEDENDGCDLAKLLLERGANVNEQDKNSATPLDLASYYKKPEILRVLLDHSAKVNTETDFGETVLHGVSCVKYESQEERVHAAQPLLERSMDVNAQRKDDWTPLHIASYHGKFEVVRLLLDHGAAANAETNNGDNPLHKVCGNSQVKSLEDSVRVVRLLLERGVDVNAQSKHKWTPLHLASHYGKPDIVRLLLDHGANVNAESENGDNPLHKVCGNSQDKSQEDGAHIARLLLECGVDVNAQPKHKWTPLHFASYHWKPDIVQLLLDHGAAANAETDNGENPLHKVSQGKYETQEHGIRVAQLLLERGIDVNAQRKDKWTPLHIASRNGKPGIVRLLLDHGANANAESENGENPLHKVCSNSQDRSHDNGVHVARLLLEQGVDVNAQPKHKWTPLHFASYYGKPDIIQLLLDHGANANTESENGENPLHKVCGNSQSKSQEDGVRVARLLLERGVDVNAQRKDKWTPLHLASYHWKSDIVRLLLDHGANANAETDNGDSPLHKVSQGKYEPQEHGVCVAQLLLERGVDVNAQRKDKWTPLHVASRNGNPGIIRLLLDHGANANTVSENGDNPLHKVCGNSEDKSQEDGVHIVRLLLERGVDVNAQPKHKWTPLHFASYYGKLETVRLLLDHGAAVSAETDNGDNPLHKVSQGTYASEDAGSDVARLLLQHGADVNAKARSGGTPIDSATRHQRFKLAQLLLENAVNVNAQTPQAS